MDYLTGGRFNEILSAIESIAGLQENTESSRVFEIPRWPFVLAATF